MTVRLVSSVEIVRIALEAGVPALVRVPARTPEYISRVLDGGALGVIAPGIGSAFSSRLAPSAPSKSGT